MNNLLYSRDDAISYLFEKRDAIQYKAQEAETLENDEGAKILRLAAEQLTAAIRFVVDVPFCK